MSDLSTETTAFSSLPTNASGEFLPFQVHVPDTDINFLKTLLSLSRLGPRTFENSLRDHRLGLPFDWLENALKIWTNSFDWREHEKYINSFPHYISPVVDDDGESYNVHFVALFSKRENAIPMLLLHGWPGSFLEFLPLMDNLRSRYSSKELPYHLVVPSLPGYAFSAPGKPDKDMRLEDTARIFNKLAVSLGFGTRGYIVQGGDVGSKVARVIASEHDQCKAIHINFCIMPEPEHLPSDALGSISSAEQVGLTRAKAFKETGSAYALEHATRPSTIGFVLGSNPLSLLAWVAEKFLDWSDEDPPVDVVLESASLYWFTNCAATSLWPYRQLFTPGMIGAHENPKWRIPTNKPFGFSWFPKELAPIPRAWAATTGHLSFYRQHDQGGHFAALEKPDELWTDIEEFVQESWSNL